MKNIIAIILFASFISANAAIMPISSDDSIFVCNKTTSDGQKIYVGINTAEANYSMELGTYDVNPCNGPYHSCIRVFTADGQGYNSTLLSLQPTSSDLFVVVKEMNMKCTKI